MRKLNRNRTSFGRLAFCLPIAVALAITPVYAHAAPKKEGKRNHAQPATDKASLKKSDSSNKTEKEAEAKPVSATAPPQAPDATAKKGTETQKLFSTDFSDAPTNISSDSLTLKNDERVFVYLGNVVVVQGNMTLTCDELEGTYTEENEIDKLYAKRNVVIIKAGETPDQNVKATSQHAVFDNKTQIATLTKNPQVEQNGSVLTADLIKMYLEEDRSVAEGQVRVTLLQQSKPDDKPKKEGKNALLGEK